MKVLLIFALCMAAPMMLSAQKVSLSLENTLKPVYNQWRASMVKKNYKAWTQVTAETRQIKMYNRIVSEKRGYPAAVFAIPTPPPSLAGLKAINVNSKGNTAVATYYGKINFGIGGNPTNNLMLLYFISEKKQWKFDRAEYINLTALPEVRKQMAKGDYSYAKHQDFMASGVAPYPDRIVKKDKVDYVAKVYVYSPGREVKVSINKDRSKHRFQNDKRAEVIIGGAIHGVNSLSFETKLLPGVKKEQPLDIRVFLMPMAKGAKPQVVFKYRLTPSEIIAGDKAKAKFQGNFTVNADHTKALLNQ